jgi:hypothetical protein
MQKFLLTAFLFALPLFGCAAPYDPSVAADVQRAATPGFVANAKMNCLSQYPTDDIAKWRCVLAVDPGDPAFQAEDQGAQSMLRQAEQQKAEQDAQLAADDKAAKPIVAWAKKYCYGGPAPAIGDTEQQVVAAWCLPRVMNKTETDGGVHKQWVYDRADGESFVYFDNGVVSAIQTP